MLSTYLSKKGGEVQKNVSRADMLAAVRGKDTLLWVDLEDPNDFEAECLVEIFNFHPLAIEDCLTDHSDPKIDDYEEHLFVVAHSIAMQHNPDKEVDELVTHELNIFFGKNYLVTFHRHPIKTIEQMRSLAEKRVERFMTHGPDMLLHAVLDRLVDNYQPVLDMFDRNIDQMEEQAFENPPADYLSKVIQLKRDIFNLRRIINPQRELINQLTRNGAYIKPKHMIYFRDINDHLFRIYTTTEGFHEALTSILQAYFSYSSHKLNEIVKHMTVMATLTMPAVIVASIYGMNFQNMPELNWEWGYPFAILVSFAISGALLAWMKIKKWI